MRALTPAEALAITGESLGDRPTRASRAVQARLAPRPVHPCARVARRCRPLCRRAFGGRWASTRGVEDRARGTGRLWRRARDAEGATILGTRRRSCCARRRRASSNASDGTVVILGVAGDSADGTYRQTFDRRRSWSAPVRILRAEDGKSPGPSALLGCAQLSEAAWLRLPASRPPRPSSALDASALRGRPRLARRAFE